MQYPWLSAEFETRREETSATTGLHVGENGQKRTFRKSKREKGKTKRRGKRTKERAQVGQEKGKPRFSVLLNKHFQIQQDRTEEALQVDMKRRREEEKGNCRRYVYFI